MASLEAYQESSGLNLLPGWLCGMEEGAIIVPDGKGTKQEETGKSHLGLVSQPGRRETAWRLGGQAGGQDKGQGLSHEDTS